MRYLAAALLAGTASVTAHAGETVLYDAAPAWVERGGELVQVLPQYEADDGPLTAVQVRQIKKHVPQGSKRSVRSSLFEAETA